MTCRILVGDCRAVMAEMEPESVDAIVCDPPYDLTAGKKGGSGVKSINLNSPQGRARISVGNGGGGFMGLSWDATGIAFDPETWKAALRVLKPGGHLLAFGGSRTHHRMMVAIEDAGFEIRDTLSWLYATGMPKSLDVSKAIDKAAGVERDRHERAAESGAFSDDNGTTYGTAISNVPVTNLAKQWAGWGTGLAPAWEPIVLARKPLIGTVAANVREHGTGALNIGACQVEANGRPLRVIDPKPEANGAVYAGRRQAGTGFDGGSRAVGVTDQGRWPKNVILDEGAAALLDEQSGVTKSGKMMPTHTTAERRIYGQNATGGYVTMETYGDEGGASRFFFVAKVGPSERGDCTHPTMKPVELMSYLVKLVTPPGGTVLDPFMGSGSTGLAADRAGFHFIGIEQSADYAEQARKRIANDAPMLTTVEVA